MTLPPPLGPDYLDALAEGSGVSVVDTREPADFRRGHIPGSILAPLGERFETVLATFVRSGGVVLVVEEGGLGEAVERVRNADLQVEGYVNPHMLAHWGAGNDKRRMLKAIDFDELDGRRHYTNVLVLDVRDPEAWERRHIPGAKNVPFGEIPERLDELPRDRTILVHCGGGLRSAIAAAFLHSRGFCVAHVDDDFSRWKERHLEEGAVAGAH